MKPYPLLFQPDMKERVWGGRALEQFGFALPDGPIGEGWMIADHANGTSKVINGSFAGLGLDAIRQEIGGLWFGTKALPAHTQQSSIERFPLLVKLLDCQDDLSIQVHPTDNYEKLPKGELGKTEMWYILDAKPGATIIYGMLPGVTREEFHAAIQRGSIMDGLQEMPVAAGDSFYIPAGTVHALKAGVLVAEIQQNSDTTYRLYDYNRLGLDGKPRELHVEDSLNVAHYGENQATRMKTGNMAVNHWLELANSPFFIVEKGIVAGKWELETTPDSFVLLIVCEGAGVIQWDHGQEQLSLKPGDCLLLPAPLGSYQLEADKMTVLRSYLP